MFTDRSGGPNGGADVGWDAASLTLVWHKWAVREELELPRLHAVWEQDVKERAPQRPGCGEI